MVNVFICDENLHTKLYILECDGFRHAILGSPNLTHKADARNDELAVSFRTTVQGSQNRISELINELTAYASALRGHAKLYK